jgi:bifunctional DNase/RNase/DNA-binding CsgD family transcriptional regulator
MVGGLRFEAIRFSGISPDPQLVVEEQELHRKVLAAVDALSPKNRAATLLFYYDQLSLREIATILDISVTAVKGRLYRSRQQLKEWLWPVYSEMILEEPRRKVMTTDMLYQEVTVVDVIHQKQETMDAYVVVLLDKEGRRILPIWIGPFESEEMAVHLLERRAPRPLTYNFIADLLEAVGARLEKVCVEALKEDIFYATAYLDSGDTVHQVDARPSDAINLALRTGSPIYIAKKVLEKVGIDVPENVWETRQLGRGMEDMAQEYERKRQEWERKREAAKSCPRPTKEEAEQKGEKWRRELLDLVFGVEA